MRGPYRLPCCPSVTEPDNDNNLFVLNLRSHSRPVTQTQTQRQQVQTTCTEPCGLIRVATLNQQCLSLSSYKHLVTPIFVLPPQLTDYNFVCRLVLILWILGGYKILVSEMHWYQAEILKSWRYKLSTRQLQTVPWATEAENHSKYVAWLRGQITHPDTTPQNWQGVITKQHFNSPLSLFYYYYYIWVADKLDHPDRDSSFYFLSIPPPANNTARSPLVKQSGAKGGREGSGEEKRMVIRGRKRGEWHSSSQDSRGTVNTQRWLNCSQ